MLVAPDLAGLERRASTQNGAERSDVGKHGEKAPPNRPKMRDSYASPRPAVAERFATFMSLFYLHFVHGQAA